MFYSVPRKAVTKFSERDGCGTGLAFITTSADETSTRSTHATKGKLTPMLSSSSPNPILAVDTLGHATPLGVAADRAGWDQLDSPTPRELLRTVFLRSHRVVVLGLGRTGHLRTLAGQAEQLLRALHGSSHTAHVIAADFGTDEAAERTARGYGVSLYVHHTTPDDLIAAAESMLPRRRHSDDTAPLAGKHPALPNLNFAPRSHLAKLLAHPPPSRAGPKPRAG